MITKKCTGVIECMANSIKVLAVVAILTILTGALGYSIFEDYTWNQNIEWSIQTLTSVGYGNYPAQTVAGSLWSSVLMLWGVVVILSLVVAVFVEGFRKDEHKMTDAEQDWIAQALIEIAEERGIVLDAYPDSSKET